ncbi:Scr1 family TA system antitoxin-like transcriptional regulator [Glycomyces terrestris]|uniref:XRE family transcriptional regulator n=1 Tax=Glycomyces terrestris TaxID=2493553 RepID=A0A426V455_9ACTN|nr:Scr1 family TA system antitoxin-like transcriptional regulator [Glycomyces terrestris]RRS01611.1 XRE family transcriptional regulator [Glycomyces terrestris]
MAKTDSGAWFIRMMLRTGRERQRRTQESIARQCHLATDTYRAYEAGRSSPPAKNMEALAKACGYDEEKAAYMAKAAGARGEEWEALEADQRFNALYIALAERFYGEIFKFDALMIPGLLQCQKYHYIVARQAEPGSDEWVDAGWVFKDGRQLAAEARKDRPVMHFLIGETALLQLRMISEELYQEQMLHLRRWARKPGVLIRILRGPVLAQRSSFEIYLPEEFPLAGPSITYIEAADSSWLIDDPTRIAGYDDIRKMLWKQAIRIEVYNDDDWRYRLA